MTISKILASNDNELTLSKLQALPLDIAGRTYWPLLTTYTMEWGEGAQLLLPISSCKPIRQKFIWQK